MSFRKRCLILLPGAILFTSAAYGQGAANCLGDVSRANSCSANDVSIAAVKQGSVNVFQGGIAGTNQCIAGGTFSFTADFEVKTTSSSTRSNIGIFFGTGQSNALHGTCTDAILSPQHSCAGGTATCGDLNYSEKDGSINGETTNAQQAACGDTASGDSSADFGPGTHAAVLEVDGVACPATGTPCPAGSGLTGTCLALPTCSSWSQPTNTLPVCESPAPNYPWVAAAVPGAPSKCTCGIVYVPITPVTITPTVKKTCNTALDGAAPDFSTNPPTPNNCNAGPEGSTATYTVQITNPSTTTGNNAVVDQVCDTQYGTIYRSGSAPSTLSACAAGLSSITASNVNCPPGGTTGIAPGGSATCSFTAVVGENVTGLTDTVSASGHSSISSTSTFNNVQSNSVTVFSTDAPSTAQTKKTVEATLAPVPVCVTARFNANVKNTSSADEDINLTALSDSHFGDLTTTHGTSTLDGSVLGTTCGVATTSAGLGTASNISAGAGAFPKTLAHGTGTPPTTDGAAYPCQFDGVICGTPGPIFNGATQICAQGIQSPSSSVVATLGPEAGEPTETVSQINTPFVANICFAVTGQ